MKELRWILAAMLAAPAVLFAAPGRDLQSVTTSLRRADCEKVSEPGDPNNTPYYKCPGPAGYALILRNAEGRQSVDVVAPEGKIHPLELWTHVTPHFSHLGDKAVWRVAGHGKNAAPGALIVSVKAHEDEAAPERVTRTYAAVAKIGAGGVCVTDKIVLKGASLAEARAAADASGGKNCLAAKEESFMRVVIMNQAGADVDLRVSAGGRELYNGAVPKMRLRPAMAFNENFPFEPGVHIVRVEDKTRGETAEQTVELKDHATLIVNLLPNSMELSVTFKKNPKFD